MTNGEKMQSDFPDIEIWGESKDTLDYSLGGMVHRVTKSWWNAEYKEPSSSENPNKSENPISSTTKNDIRDNRVKNELNRVENELEPTTKNCESCRHYGLHHEICNYCYKCSLWKEKEPTTKNNLGVREFEELVVEYPPEDLCIYPEYKGKPYFGIKYKENGKEIVGYGTYKPQVLSRYLKDYFMPTIKNDLAHNLCNTCTNKGCEFQSGIVRTECAFYMPPHLEPDNCGNYVEHLVPRNVVERIIKSPRTKEQMLSVLNSLPPQEPSGDDVVSRDVVKEQMIMYGFHAPDMTVTEFVEDLPPVNPKETTTKNDLEVEKIIDEVEKEIEKVDIPSTDKLIILAKVQNALYKCAVSG